MTASQQSRNQMTPFERRRQIRYNLHHALKLQNAKVAGSSKTIFISPDAELSKEMLRLRDEFQYTIQTEIQ